MTNEPPVTPYGPGHWPTRLPTMTIDDLVKKVAELEARIVKLEEEKGRV